MTHSLSPCDTVERDFRSRCLHMILIPEGEGDFLMSGIRICATDQGQFFTSKNPEQAQIFEVLLQNRS